MSTSATDSRASARLEQGIAHHGPVSDAPGKRELGAHLGDRDDALLHGRDREPGGGARPPLPGCRIDHRPSGTDDAEARSESSARRRVARSLTWYVAPSSREGLAVRPHRTWIVGGGYPVSPMRFRADRPSSHPCGRVEDRAPGQLLLVEPAVVDGDHLGRHEHPPPGRDLRLDVLAGHSEGAQLRSPGQPGLPGEEAGEARDRCVGQPSSAHGQETGSSAPHPAGPRQSLWMPRRTARRWTTRRLVCPAATRRSGRAHICRQSRPRCVRQPAAAASAGRHICERAVGGERAAGGGGRASGRAGCGERV